MQPSSTIKAQGTNVIGLFICGAYVPYYLSSTIRTLAYVIECLTVTSKIPLNVIIPKMECVFAPILTSFKRVGPTVCSTCNRAHACTEHIQGTALIEICTPKSKHHGSENKWSFLTTSVTHFHSSIFLCR